MTDGRNSDPGPVAAERPGGLTVDDHVTAQRRALALSRAWAIGDIPMCNKLLGQLATGRDSAALISALLAQTDQLGRAVLGDQWPEHLATAQRRAAGVSGSN